MRLKFCFLFLFIYSYSSAQHGFIRAYGEPYLTIFSDWTYTTDDGFILGGNDLNGDIGLQWLSPDGDSTLYHVTPPNSVFSFKYLTELKNKKVATLGDENNSCLFYGLTTSGNVAAQKYFYTSQWSTKSRDLFSTADSGFVTIAYDDGALWHNSLIVGSFDKNFYERWTIDVPSYDASVSPSSGFDTLNHHMYFLIQPYNGIDPYSLMKLHENGILDNAVSYPNIRYCHLVNNTNDGGAILAGKIDSLGSDEIYIAKINSGVVQWRKSFGTIYDDSPVAIEQTSDGGFIILATQFLTSGIQSFTNGIDIELFKTDSLGNLEWQRTYGSIGNENAIKISQLIDGGFAFSAKTNGFGYKSLLLIRTDSLGNISSPYIISSHSNDYCTGDTAVLSISPTPLQCLWSTGDTTSSISVTSAGDYEATVWDSAGQHHVSFFSVHFFNQPDATLNFDSTNYLCDSSTVVLTAANELYTSYYWYHENNLVVDSHFNRFSIDTTGTYYLITSNVCGSDTSDIATFIQAPKPAKPIVAFSPSNPVCFGDTLIVKALTTGDEFHWHYANFDFVDSSIYFAQHFNYSVQVAAVNSFGCISSPLNFNVSTMNPPDIFFTPQSLNLCSGGYTNLLYYTNEVHGQIYVYNDFQFFDSTTTNASNGTYSINDAGYYYLIQQNMCGTDTSDTVLVHSLPLPEISIVPQHSNICNGSPVTLTCLNDSGTYGWFVSPPSFSKSIVVNTSGNYKIQFRDNITGCADTASVIVGQLNSNPINISTLNDTVICPGQMIDYFAPSDFTSYYWSSGDTTTSVNFANTGQVDTIQYMLYALDSNLCMSSDTFTIIYDDCVGVNEMSENNIISIYPNPAFDFIHVELNTPDYDNAIFHLFNADGKLVVITPLTKYTIVDSKNLSTGVYYYQIIFKNEIIFRDRLVILE